MRRLLATMALYVAMTAEAVCAEQYQQMIFSCYCPESCPGTTTASGQKVREGILACSKDHMGDCAMLYTLEGDFIGFYECLDTGGSKALKEGRAVDVWTPNLTRARELMKLTNGEVMVMWIQNPKG